MTPLREISAAVARRFLVLRHFLAPPRALPANPSAVMTVVDRLGSLQFDPLEVAGRNHDLVLLARIAEYRREWTDGLLYEDRLLFEAYNKGLSLLPTSELPWFRVSWDRAATRHHAETFGEHAPLVEELLARIRAEGPLSSIDVEPRAAIDWYWRPTNQVRAILEALGEAGILGLARRAGNRRYYDLAERLFPPELLELRPSVEDQLRHKLLSRYRAHGLLGQSGSAELWYGTGPAREGNGANAEAPTRTRLRNDLIAAGSIQPVAVEGVRGVRYMIESERAILERAEREVAEGSNPGGHRVSAVFLAPLDPFMWDRDFTRQLFGFDYVWEVYVPAAKRRWGYYVLPILFRDRLVGRIEPRIDRQGGALRVLDLWWEEGFDPLTEPGFIDALAAALEAHRLFGGVRRVSLPRSARHRPLVGELRDRVRPGGTGSIR